MQTLEQRRAAHAYQAILLAKSLKEEEKKKYGVHVKKLPSRIIASGLGQSLAFLAAKDFCPDLLRSLAHWCLTKQEHPGAEKLKVKSPNELLISIVQGTSEDLRFHTAESLAYLQWLGRFAEAEGLKGQE